MKARYYQAQALENLASNIDAGKPDNLVVIPVGGGKSVVIAHNALYALKKHPKGKVILLAHRKELSTQNAEKITACDPNVSIGFEKAEQVCEPSNQIMVASVQTIGKKGIPRVRKWADPKDIAAILIDEAHHIPGGKTYQVLLEELREANPNLIITGFTATPKRGDGERIDAYIKHIAYEVTMQELVEAKYLARLRGIKVKTQTSMANFVGEKKKDFDETELSNLVNNDERNQLAVDIYKAKHMGEHALVFCVSKAHAEQVGALLIRNGVKATVITEDTPKDVRENIKKDLASGKTDVLVSVGVLTEGFDVPTIKVLLMLRPTKSPVLFEQMIGRGVRLIAFPNPDDKDGEWLIDWETKSYCTVYDFVDQKAEASGAYNLAKMVGLNTEFDLNGQDVFEVKTILDAQTQGEPLLEAAIQNCRSMEEINALLESHDILAEIQSIHYAPDQNLGWMEVGKEESWIQLPGRGEVARVEKNALGAFTLHIPEINLGKRFAERQKWEQENPGKFTTPATAPTQEVRPPETRELEATTMTEALQKASDIIIEILPLDAPLLRQNSKWREESKSQPATEGQKKQIEREKLKLAPEKIETLSKAEASELISKSKLQKKLMVLEERITFGKYLGAPAFLVQIYDPGYMAFMLTKPDFLSKNNMLEAFQNATTKNPIPWLEHYRPHIYKKDFAGMEEAYERYFTKDPQDVYKVIKFALEQDPANQWPLIAKKAQEFAQEKRRAA